MVAIYGQLPARARVICRNVTNQLGQRILDDRTMDWSGFFGGSFRL